MKEYDTRMVNSKELAFLRANTMLGPIATLKIEKMRAEAEKLRQEYFKAEGELLEADHSFVDEFE